MNKTSNNHTVTHPISSHNPAYIPRKTKKRIHFVKEEAKIGSNSNKPQDKCKIQRETHWSFLLMLLFICSKKMLVLYWHLAVLIDRIKLQSVN